MSKIDKTNLGYLGLDFQYKLIKSFMDEPKFFKEIFNAIDQNVFTDAHLKLWVGIMKDYFIKHETVPSYSIMEIKLRDKSNSEKDVDTFTSLITQLKTTTSEGVDEIKELSTKFFQQQAWIKVANSILRKAGDGSLDNYEECATLVENLMNVGKSDDDFGFSPLDNIDETLSNDYRITLPTGIGRIDEILEGGLGKGELGVIIGPTSFGKTSLTTAIASYAATHRCDANNNDGYKVLQIVFEDRVKQIQRKHIGRMTKVEAKDLSKPDYIEGVKATLEACEDKEMIRENVRIKKFASGEITVTGLKSFIKALINTGFRPDMVIVDYFECLEHERDKNGGRQEEWSKEGQTMRKLEAMAEEFNIGIWVPTQGTKDSINSEIVTMDKAGGSIKKIQIGHIIMSIARTNEDIENNKAAIGILKNRAGKAGSFIKGVEFNNGTCIVSTDSLVEFDSALAYKEEEKRAESEFTQKLGQEIFGNKK